MGERRASILGLVAAVTAGCDPGGSTTSSWQLVSPPAAAAGWTVQTAAGLARGTPQRMELAVSPAGAVVGGTLQAVVGSTKGAQDIGRDGAYVWRCADAPCRRAAGALTPTDIITPTTTGFTAASGSGGRVRVVRCTAAGCESAPTSHPTGCARHRPGNSSGRRIRGSSGSRSPRPPTARCTSLTSPAT